jgi:hypothetical protein
LETFTFNFNPEWISHLWVCKFYCIELNCHINLNWKYN